MTRGRGESTRQSAKQPAGATSGIAIERGGHPTFTRSGSLLGLTIQEESGHGRIETQDS